MRDDYSLALIAVADGRAPVRARNQFGISETPSPDVPRRPSQRCDATQNQAQRRGQHRDRKDAFTVRQFVLSSDQQCKN